MGPVSPLYLPASPCISPASLARLEEEQERAAGLEAEKGALAQQLQEARQEATHSRAALREMQQELEDEREARARADKQLAQALDHG